MAGRTPRLIVVSGIQGSGKTTVSGLLARQFERAVHIEADALQRMIVSGGSWAGDAAPGTPTGAADKQLRLRLRNACLLARSFVEAGFDVVIDDLIIGERFGHLRSELAGTPFWLVILAPDLETVIARDARRQKSVGKEWSRYLNGELLRMRRDIGLWVDSSSQTPDETVAEIMARIDSDGLIESET